MPRLPLVVTGALLASVLAGCSTNGGQPTQATSDSSSGAAPGTIVVGLIDDQTGPSALFGPPSTDVVKLAVAQLNQAGGVNGRRISLVTEDGATNPATSKAAAQRLIGQDHVTALFAMVSTAQSTAVAPVAKAASVPYFYTPIWEGGVCDADLFSTGEVPAQQLAPTIPWVQRRSGHKKWYLLGDDYSWPRQTFALAKKYIAAAGGKVVGEDYVPLGTTDYSAVISKIQNSGADIMIPALVGSDAIAFEKQAYDAGLGNSVVQRLAVLYEDNTRGAMGAKVTAGMYFATNYDQTMGSAANTAFLSAYHGMFGAKAPAVTTLSEHVYVAVKAWSQAASAAKSTDLTPLAKALSDLRLDTPGGPVSFGADHYLTQSISVDQIQGNGTAKVVKTFDAVDPAQTCAS
jgi:urea transport system substrate-binding protein